MPRGRSPILQISLHYFGVACVNILHFVSEEKTKDKHCLKVLKDNRIKELIKIEVK